LLKVNSTDLPVVDSREPESIWMPLVELGWQKKALPSADFSLPAAGGKTVGIERKTVDDFIASMRETPEERKHGHRGGRLVRQARRMVEDYAYAHLILENSTAGRILRDSEGNMGDGFTYDSFADSLLTIQEMGLTWEITFGTNHTIQRLTHLRARYLKGVRSHFQRSLALDPQVAALSLTPGIGEKKARQLVEAGFKLQMGDMTDGRMIAELTALPGFGEATAKRIVEYWK